MPQTKPIANDKFEKSNKGLIIAGSIGAGLIAFGGLILLAKNGKLGEDCKRFVNKIFKFNNGDIPAGAIDKNKTAKIIPNEPQKKTGEVVNRFFATPSGAFQDDIFTPMEAKLSDDVAQDVDKWLKYREELPEFCDSLAEPGKKLKNQPAFCEFEIKPHAYTENNSAIFQIRQNSQLSNLYDGYVDVTYADGKLHRIGCCESLCPEFAEGNIGNIAVGFTEDGKRAVCFTFQSNSQDSAGRFAPMIVSLISDTEEFTQAQKDIIKIYSLADSKYAQHTVDNPLALCYAHEPEVKGSAKNFSFNFNTFLSAIQTWAGKLGSNFDIDKAVEKFTV